MTAGVITVHPGETLRHAVNLLRMHRIRHLPVVEDGKLLGILTDRDIKRATPSLLSGGGQTEHDRVLDQTRISQIMTREPISVRSDASIKEALELLVHRKIGALPVVDHDELVGIITEVDFLREFARRL